MAGDELSRRKFTYLFHNHMAEKAALTQKLFPQQIGLETNHLIGQNHGPKVVVDRPFKGETANCLGKILQV